MISIAPARDEPYPNALPKMYETPKKKIMKKMIKNHVFLLFEPIVEYIVILIMGVLRLRRILPFVQDDFRSFKKSP